MIRTLKDVQELVDATDRLDHEAVCNTYRLVLERIAKEPTHIGDMAAKALELNE